MTPPTVINEILGKSTSVHLSDNDVVFGRGGFANRHPGNKKYLQLISEHEEAYMDCKRKYQKLLSLCIIHHLRSKGVQFLKKDEKSGNWTTVKLSQCRLKISQRLRERAPFIKLEHMKTSTGLTKAIRPITSISATAAARIREYRSVSLPMPPPVEHITVTDASSDEDDGMDSICFDDSSFYGGDSMALQPSFESFLSALKPTGCYEPLFQTEEERHGKRYADSMFELEYPQRKRPRKVSMDAQDEYADMLLKEASLLDDISVDSFSLAHEEAMGDMELYDLDQTFAADFVEPGGEMMEYLQVLL